MRLGTADFALAAGLRASITGPGTAGAIKPGWPPADALASWWRTTLGDLGWYG